MSQQASTNFIASFDSLVKHAYQQGSKLRDTVRVKTGVVGSTHRFPKMGKGVASERVPQTDVIPMNISHSNATATLQDWNAPEYTDIYDLSKLNFDERSELAKVIGYAMGRRLDQLIIDAADSGANSTTVGTDVGGTATGLNLEKILRAKRLMDDAGVPEEGRTMVTSAQAVEQALLDAEITSRDYNALMPLMEGALTRFAGFEFKFIESRTEGGIAKPSTRTNLAYHRDAVGLAIGLDMRTDVTWVSEKTSWLTNGIFSAGAVTIDDEGVYEVLTTEA